MKIPIRFKKELDWYFILSSLAPYPLMIRSSFYSPPSMGRGKGVSL